MDPQFMKYAVMLKMDPSTLFNRPVKDVMMEFELRSLELLGVECKLCKRKKSVIQSNDESVPDICENCRARGREELKDVNSNIDLEEYLKGKMLAKQIDPEDEQNGKLDR